MTGKNRSRSRRILSELLSFLVIFGLHYSLIQIIKMNNAGYGGEKPVGAVFISAIYPLFLFWLHKVITLKKNLLRLTIKSIIVMALLCSLHPLFLILKNLSLPTMLLFLAYCYFRFGKKKHKAYNFKSRTMVKKRRAIPEPNIRAAKRTIEKLKEEATPVNKPFWIKTLLHASILILITVLSYGIIIATIASMNSTDPRSKYGSLFLPIIYPAFLYWLLRLIAPDISMRALCLHCAASTLAIGLFSGPEIYVITFIIAAIFTMSAVLCTIKIKGKVKNKRPLKVKIDPQTADLLDDDPALAELMNRERSGIRKFMSKWENSRWYRHYYTQR